MFIFIVKGKTVKTILFIMLQRLNNGRENRLQFKKTPQPCPLIWLFASGLINEDGEQMPKKKHDQGRRNSKGNRVNEDSVKNLRNCKNWQQMPSGRHQVLDPLGCTWRRTVIPFGKILQLSWPQSHRGMRVIPGTPARGPQGWFRISVSDWNLSSLWQREEQKNYSFLENLCY